MNKMAIVNGDPCWSNPTDVTSTTNIFAQLHKKEILMNGYNYPDNLLALFFLLEEELVIKKVL